MAFAPIDPEELWRLIKRQPPTAGGLDGVLPSEARHLPLIAAHWLAALYQLVEDGVPWPSDLCHGRLAGILKPGEHPLDPSSYRWLTILT